MSFIASFRRALMGALLSFAAVSAWAGPTYHVSVDATGLSGPGYLDLVFTSAGATGATATLSNLNAAVHGVESIGAAGATGAGVYAIDSVGYNDLSLLVDFPQIFTFDLSFDGDIFANASDYQSALMLSLLDTGYAQLNDGTLFTITPFSDEAPAGIELAADALTIVQPAVAAVPEASEWAIFITGLGLMSWTLRRRQQR